MLPGSYGDKVIHTFQSGRHRLVQTAPPDSMYFVEQQEGDIWKMRPMPVDLIDELVYLLQKSNDHWTIAHDYEEHIQDGEREMMKKITRLEEENASNQAATASLKAAFNGFITSIVRK